MSRIIKLGDTFTKREVLAMFGIPETHIRKHRYDLGEMHGRDFAMKFLSLYRLPQHVFGSPTSEKQRLYNTYPTTLAEDADGSVIFTNETLDGTPRPEYGEGGKLDERGKTLILFTMDINNADDVKAKIHTYQGEFRFERHEGHKKWIFKRMKTETSLP